MRRTLRDALADAIRGKRCATWGQSFSVAGKREWLDHALDYYVPTVEEVLFRMAGAVGSGPAHEVLGMDVAEYELAMMVGRDDPSWEGMPASNEPRWHSHPNLGIPGHAHSQVEVARAPHTHRPEVGWDWTPLPAPEAGILW